MFVIFFFISRQTAFFVLFEAVEALEKRNKFLGDFIEHLKDAFFISSVVQPVARPEL